MISLIALEWVQASNKVSHLIHLVQTELKRQMCTDEIQVVESVYKNFKP